MCSHILLITCILIITYYTQSTISYAEMVLDDVLQCDLFKRTTASLTATTMLCSCGI